uniref:Uncharacterized protein n=1 Tax=Prolemur simus TaxID=1328070 RepID=A0A8C8ZBM1_PROSS
MWPSKSSRRFFCVCGGLKQSPSVALGRAWCALHTSGECAENHMLRICDSKGYRPVSYEEAHAPHHITHNLDGEDHPAANGGECFPSQVHAGYLPRLPGPPAGPKAPGCPGGDCALVLRHLPAQKSLKFFPFGRNLSLLSPFNTKTCKVWHSSQQPWELRVTVLPSPKPGTFCSKPDSRHV